MTDTTRSQNFTNEAQPLLHDAVEWKPALRFARLITCVTSLAEGYSLSVVAGVYEHVEEDLDLSEAQSAFFLGFSGFAIAVGAPLGGSLADSIGRVKSLILGYVLIIAGDMAMSSAYDYRLLLFGRLFESLGIGVGLTVVTTYMSEVAPTKIRGGLPSLEEFFIVCGVMLGYFSNYLLGDVDHGWRWMIRLGALLPALFLLPVWLGMHESPRYLAATGRVEEARASLGAFVEDAEVVEASESWSQEDSVSTWAALLCLPEGPDRKALALSVFAMSMHTFSGIHILTVFSTTYFENYLDERSAYFITLLTGIWRVIILVPIILRIDEYGRRLMLMCSVGGLSLSCFILAGLVAINAYVVPWHMFGIMLFYTSYSLGCGPVTWVFCAEVLGNRVRSKGVSLGIFLARVLGGIEVTVFALVEDDVDYAVVFLFLAACNAAGWLVMWSFLPETKGVALEAMHTRYAASTGA